MAMWKAEMTAWSLALPVLRRTMTIQRLSRLMWEPARGPRMPSTEVRLMRWGARVSRLRLRRQANCLERSLLLYRFLSRAGAEPRLVLGVAHFGDGIAGHAWVVIDDHSVLESDAALEGFAPVLEFGAGGVPVESNGDDVLLPQVWR